MTPRVNKFFFELPIFMFFLNVLIMTPNVNNFFEIPIITVFFKKCSLGIDYNFFFLNHPLLCFYKCNDIVSKCE